MNEVERNPASALQVDVSRDGVVATVTVTGELDITTAPSLTRRLLEVGAAHPDRLVLDLSGLVFVDVAGARALDEAHTLLQAECPVILRTPRPSARKFPRACPADGGLERSHSGLLPIPRHLSGAKRSQV
jgi:anti-anti-sigma factor